jgi:hypothetical protein
VANTSVTVNIPGHRAVVRTTANTTIEMSTIASAGENTSIMTSTVKSILWNGNTTISRESNTLLTLVDTGEWDFAGRGISIEIPGGNLSSNIVVTTLGTCILELAKQSNLSGPN